MLQRQFTQNIERLGVSRRNDKILLAVSGGIDSMVMANLFVKNNFNVGIAHCNFLLRGADSNGDEEFVKAFAESKNIPFFSIKFDTKKYASENKISIEMAARDLRYAWFDKLLTDNNYTKLAIAHNLNDAAETFFLNLTRGTGIKGLTGIAETAGNIIRPILFATRKQIEDYAKQCGIAFRNDVTNDSNDYTRNKIRHKIIPELEKINPSFLQTMQNNMRHIAQNSNIIEHLVSKMKKDFVKTENGKIYIDISDLKNNDDAQIFLFDILSEYNFNSTNVGDIVLALNGESGRKFFSPTHILVKDRNNLIIAKRENDENCEIEIDENSNAISYPIDLRFEKIENKNIKIEKKCNIAYLNFDKLKFPLTLRKWKAGDSFTPFGMSGKKKLSDYFINIKLSQFDKNEQYVLLSDNKVVWVVNRRIDEAYRVNESCKTILKIEFVEKQK